MNPGVKKERENEGKKPKKERETSISGTMVDFPERDLFSAPRGRARIKDRSVCL
jgi:hypothetical protein